MDGINARYDTRQRKTETITLIFDQHPGINDTFLMERGHFMINTNPEVSCYDDFSFKELYLNSDELKDTVRLLPRKEYLVIKLRLDAVNYYEFLLRKEDTVAIRYDGSHPHLSVLNRATRPFDFQYEEICSKKFYAGFSCREDQYFNARLFLKYSILKGGYDAAVVKAKSTVYAKQICNLSAEQLFLDSLSRHDLVSPDVYEFYKNRIQNLVLLLGIAEGKLSLQDVTTLIRKDSLSLNGYPDLYYYKFLENVTDRFYTAQASEMDLKDGVNKDYREVFKAIAASPIFTQKAKNYLLTREVFRIGRSFSREDFCRYFQKYEQFVSDTVMVGAVAEANLLAFDTVPPEKKIMSLIDNDKGKLNFEELKLKHRGKVIYLDFWASWCVPCRMALPYSVKLKEQLKAVVFVYLSLDDNYEDWRKASGEEGINNYTENYLVINPDDCDFIKQYKIQSIPRYMIYDKEGRLVFRNAMDVGSKNLPGILHELSLR